MSVMPEGVKIYFGDSLNKKIAIENILKNIFEKNCYNLIELPMYEFYNDLVANFSNSIKKKMYKFVDRDSGEVVALRPDMTSLLAKLVKLRDENMVLPERIYYVGDVFRYDKIKSGVYREISQAGIELIGESGYKADVEVIVMAIEALKSLGLSNPKIEIGDVGIFNNVISKLGIKDEEIDTVKDFILRKDIPSLRKYFEGREGLDILLKLPTMIGKKDILNGMEEYGTENLKKVADILDEIGYKDNYIIDLGIVKEMEYYTGLVFNGFCDNARDFILNGGRYDKLMGTSALGFVINIDAVVEIAQGMLDKEKAGILIVGKNYKKTLEVKYDLISKGEKVQIFYKEVSNEVLKKYALKKGYKYILNVDTDEKYEVKGDI